MKELLAGLAVFYYVRTDNPFGFRWQSINAVVNWAKNDGADRSLQAVIKYFILLYFLS